MLPTKNKEGLVITIMIMIMLSKGMSQKSLRTPLLVGRAFPTWQVARKFFSVLFYAFFGRQKQNGIKSSGRINGQYLSRSAEVKLEM